MPRKKVVSIGGIDEDKFKQAAQKVETEIDEGYRILLQKWNTPYDVEIDGATIKVMRPNLSQTMMMLSSVQSLTNPPSADDVDAVVEYLDKIRKNIAPVLGSLIIEPKPLNTVEFWESGEYPFDFLVRLLTEILNRFGQEARSVETFRED